MRLARHTNMMFGAYAYLVPSMQDLDAASLARAAASWAAEAGLWSGERAALVLSGKFEANADMQPQLSVLSPEELAPAALPETPPCPRLGSLRALRRTQSITA